MQGPFRQLVSTCYRRPWPWASCLHTLPPQFLSSKKLGVQKGVFGAWSSGYC